MNRSVVLTTVATFLAVVVMASTVNAQRIGIEESTSDTGSQQTEGPTSSSRIIPPEEFGKYRDQKQQRSELTKEALIEKLRADSASMRIRFRETLRELRSDSKAMAKTIEKLRKKNRQLQRKLARLEGSTGVQPPEEPEPTPADTSIEPNLRSTDTEASSDTPEESKSTETSDDQKEQVTRKYNPNSASLSSLKSIPELSDRLAERIEWYRREVRPFENLQDLRRVPGIDRSVFDRIKKYFHEGPY